MDVDGTMTDGKIYMGEQGEVMKAFSVKDGQGISTLRKMDVQSVVITKRASQIVLQRCAELKIPPEHIHQQIQSKVSVIEEYISRLSLNLDSFAYIGDDINDIPAIELVKKGGGLTACPADAMDSVKRAVDYICTRKGGEGAVRDFIDYMITRY